MPRMQKLSVDGIEAGTHARPIEQTHVTALAQSMEALGLRTPIEVQMTDGEHAMLVTGMHRLMAATRVALLTGNQPCNPRPLRVAQLSPNQDRLRQKTVLNHNCSEMGIPYM